MPSRAAALGLLDAEDVPSLVCPDCRGPLVAHRLTGPLRDGGLRCDRCPTTWPIRHGWAWLYRDHAIQGPDRFMRRLYNALARVHDPAVRFGIPLFELGGTEDRLRGHYIDRLELDGVRGGRVLEVGVGTGANLPRLRHRLGSSAEIWGLDPSLGMIRQCRRRVVRDGLDVTLLLGDAHALPFPDSSFDRVFHVGGINGFRDPARALAELARVARPGTPIVVVDEQLDPSGRHNLWHKLTFRAVTFYDRDPRSPAHLLPAGATDVRQEQASRFFYCLTFRCVGGSE